MAVDRLSTTLAALADPTRRAILARLAPGEMAVGELARPFDMSLPAISKHLKVLERAGLIERSREAQWRPCRLDAAPLRDAADFLERYRRFWEQSLDRLDEYLRKLQKSGTHLKEKKKMSAESSLAMEPAERVLVIERTFNAPRPLVFKAWTEPERVAQWFGPQGFKTTV